MTLTHQAIARSAAAALAAVGSVAVLVAALAWPVAAQSTSDPAPRQPKSPSPPAERAVPPSDPKQQQQQPPGAARPILPQARSDGARALEKLPQTAEEKRRALSDLYAQLAAAENEEEAGKLAENIERLWRLSGSDTVNLLISRAAKVTAEKKVDLAEQLLDRAVTLAPDYTEGFSQRAFFYFSQNNLTAALGDLRRVLALDPNHFKAMEGIAQIWRETSNKKGAYEVLKQLLDVHPFSPGAKQAYDELKREVEGRGI
jgi:tetratricopeptide (TPR) repeat protein